MCIYVNLLNITLPLDSVLDVINPQHLPAELRYKPQHTEKVARCLWSHVDVAEEGVEPTPLSLMSFYTFQLIS